MEKQEENYLKKQVERAGGMCIKFPPLFYFGFPDRICLFPGGLIVFVETKAEGKKPRPLQIKVHNKLRTLGFRVEVLDSHQSIDNFMYGI